MGGPIPPQAVKLLDSHPVTRPASSALRARKIKKELRITAQTRSAMPDPLFSSGRNQPPARSRCVVWIAHIQLRHYSDVTLRVLLHPAAIGRLVCALSTMPADPCQHHPFLRPLYSRGSVLNHDIPTPAW